MQPYLFGEESQRLRLSQLGDSLEKLNVVDFEIFRPIPFLAGAEVADRVVGKAVAAMLVKGGVKNVYADMISLSALTLLRNAGIDTDYDQLVTYIKNTRLTDWCPVEAMCYNEQTVDEILPIVQQFVEDKESFFKSQS